MSAPPAKQGSNVFTYELLFEMDPDAAWRISSF
jgi:hypothetical protein